MNGDSSADERQIVAPEKTLSTNSNDVVTKIGVTNGLITANRNKKPIPSKLYESEAE